jgi:hypothetical protein
MPILKRVLCRERLRRVPSQFSWIDHRLVRDRHICGRSHPALALYLFLITVCDGEGLSYYSDPTLARLLSLDELTLPRARQELITARLIAYQRPLYQVLALDPPDPPPAPARLTVPQAVQAVLTPTAASVPEAPRERCSQPVALGQIFREMLEPNP